MATKKLSDRRLFRILSLVLLVGAAMLYVRAHTRSMAAPYLVEAILFAVIFGGFVKIPSRPWLALPCLPALVYHVVRLWNFLLAGTWLTLYFVEVALLAVAYALAIVMFCAGKRSSSLRNVTLLVFAVCIGFGVWDIIDGWWILMNHTWTPIAERLSLFGFYYIPDTLFWILPFVMMGKVILDHK